MATKSELQKIPEDTKMIAVEHALSKLPKATHKQSIESVMRAIAINADTNVSQDMKDAAARIAIGIVSNSNSMDLADQADKGLEMQRLMDAMANQI